MPRHLIPRSVTQQSSIPQLLRERVLVLRAQLGNREAFSELVHFALDKLSVIHREIMTRRFLEEMDVKEIARVMQCSEGTAKSRLHYATNAMRRIISEERDHA